jgi:large subunit ribosomal protein L17
MRHKNAGRKFDRNTSSRRAMLRNLTANLILHEKIETTDAKAKELRRVAERLITKARRLGPIAYTVQSELKPADRARRLAAARVISAYIPRFGVRVETGGATTRIDLVEKVLLDLAKRYADRAGGYTRIVKFGPRRGDGAPISLIELVEQTDKAEGAEPEKKGGAKAKSKGGKKATAAAPTEGAKTE